MTNINEYYFSDYFKAKSLENLLSNFGIEVNKNPVYEKVFLTINNMPNRQLSCLFDLIENIVMTACTKQNNTLCDELERSQQKCIEFRDRIKDLQNILYD